MFRTDLSIRAFCRQFYHTSPAIHQQQSSRWTEFMGAIRDGRHLERPAVRPTWRPRKEYHRPIYGRLQSSYDDVEFELNHVRNSQRNRSFVFVAGDGLSLMRMNHLLSMNPDKYIFETPAVVPIQGEPHDCAHDMFEVD